MTIKGIALVVLGVTLLAVAQTAPTFNPPEFIWGAPIATSVTQCIAPPAHGAAICPVETASGVVYYNWTGTAFVLQASTGVTSVFGRTGNVTAANGDYAYAQIAGTPPPPPVTSV